MSRYLLSFCAAGAGVLLSAGRALAQCTPECRAVPEPAVEFFRLWLPAVSSWPALAPACSSDACPAAGLVPPGVSMFQSLFVVIDAMPDPFLWIGAGLLVVVVVGLQFGRDVAIAIGGILAAAGAVALGLWLLAAWYAVDPRFVVGLLVGVPAGVVLALALVALWASFAVAQSGE